MPNLRRSKTEKRKLKVLFQEISAQKTKRGAGKEERGREA